MMSKQLLVSLNHPGPGADVWQTHNNIAAKRTSLALARLVPNMSSWSKWKRRILCSTLDSQLLCSASEWINPVAASARMMVNLI